jgi:hypothetical protein
VPARPRRGLKPGQPSKALAKLLNGTESHPDVPLPVVDDLEPLLVHGPDPKGREKYDWTIVKPLLEAIARGMPARWASRRVGITDRTYYRWQQEREDFAAMVETMEARRMEYLTNLIMVAAPDNWAAAMTMLERLHPSDFGRKDRVDHHYTGEVGIDVRKVLISDEAINAASAFERALQEGKVLEGEVVRQLPEHSEEVDTNE